MDDLESQTDWLHNVIQGIVHVEWLSTALTAVIALVITAIVAHLLTRFLRRVISRDNNPLPTSSIFVNIGRVVVWCLGLSVVLSSCFGVDVSAAVTALGIGGIAISLGFQDTLSNLISGMQVTITGLVKPGDNIQVGSQSGIVRDVSWRHTTIVNSLGEEISIPNSVINTSALVHLPPLRKLSIPLMVTDDGKNLDALAVSIVRAATQAAGNLLDPANKPRLLFVGTNEYGYKAQLIMWITDDDVASDVKDRVIRAIAPFCGPTP